MKEKIFGRIDQYKVREDGKIFSRFKKIGKSEYGISNMWRELKPVFCVCDKHGGGYLSVSLRIEENKTKTIKVHRIVAEYLVEGRKDDLNVNHIDGNRLNNNAKNLEWVTHKENIQNAIKRGAMYKIPHKIDYEKYEKIIELKKSGISDQEIAHKFNVSRRTIERSIEKFGKGV